MPVLILFSTCEAGIVGPVIFTVNPNIDVLVPEVTGTEKPCRLQLRASSIQYDGGISVPGYVLWETDVHQGGSSRNVHIVPSVGGVPPGEYHLFLVQMERYFGSAAGWIPVSNCRLSPPRFGLGIPTGAVSVSLTPSNARWKLDDGIFAQTNGASLCLLRPGIHWITFLSVAGYQTPSVLPVTVEAGKVTSVSVRYPIETWDLVLTAGPGGAVSGGGSYPRGAFVTAAATPSPGYAFLNWTEDNLEVSNSQTNAFALTANRALCANFVPFSAGKGSYAGLFSSENHLDLRASGSFTATVTDRGRFTGKVQYPGASYSISGQFGPDRQGVKYVQRKGQSTLTIVLRLDLLGEKQMIGTVSDGDQRSELYAARNVFSKSNPMPGAPAKYTFVMPGSNETAEPGGHGFATITVTTTGNLKLQGVLADGTKLSHSTFVSSGIWPLFEGLYSGKGAVLGWMETDAEYIGGSLWWAKLPSSSSYPAGFDRRLQAHGAVYTAPPRSPILSWNDGQCVLEYGNLPQVCATPVQFDSVKSKASGPNKLSISFTPATGAFKGTITNPTGTGRISLSGVVVQNESVAYGYFLGGQKQSGRVEIRGL